MTILLYSLVPLDRWTNGMRQPGAWPVLPPIRQWMTGWLVRPPTHYRVSAQQPHSLHDITNSVPTRYRTNSLHGLQAKTKPLRPGDSQWIHKENAVHHQRSQVHNLQGTRGHDALLQSKEISGLHVQTQRPGIPRCIGYQNDTSISKVVTSQTGTLWDWMPSRTVSLLPLSQTSFSHISINYSTILTVSMDTESPWKDLLINTSHVSKQSVMAEILGRSTGNHHSTIY